MNDLQTFYGPNAGYVLELYERFQRDPTSVDPATRAFFQTWPPPPSEPPAEGTHPSGIQPSIVVGAANLAQSIRQYGHLAADIDPLGSRPLGDPSLLLE